MVISKKKMISYLTIFLIIAALSFYYFLINIYGSEIKKYPLYLYAIESSLITIEVVPINALGTRALFRSSSASFDIIEGADLIEIVKKDNSKGMITIRSKGKIGVVGIKIKSVHSLLPEYVEVNILPLSA